MTTGLAYLAAGFVVAVLLVRALILGHAESVARAAREYNADPLEAPGLCSRCWGDCPPSGCLTRLPKADVPEPSDYAYSDAHEAFPALTSPQLRSVIQRRTQEGAA